MKRILLLGAFVLAILFIPLSQVQAACCTGRGCNPSTLPPVACAPSYCDTQTECDAIRVQLGGSSGNNTTGGQNIFGSKNGKQCILTALGCIVVEGTDFVTTLLNFGIGIAGGIAMLLIIFGGFQILTSAGNPERLNAGKELISSAITGLLMIVFSTFLLKVIGVNILCIPGFGPC